jgi:hypothetical protein
MIGVCCAGIWSGISIIPAYSATADNRNTTVVPKTVAPKSASQNDSAQPGYLPSYPLPDAPSAQPDTDEDEAPGEIQWSSKKPSAGTSSAKRRTFEMGVPLRDGAFYIGDITARVTPSGSASVPNERLQQMLSPLLRPTAQEALKNMQAAADGHIALTTLQGAGFDITFDPGKVEMQINPTVEQRAVGHLSAGQGRESVTSANLTPPAVFAGYLNMRAGADYATHSFYDGDGTTPPVPPLNLLNGWSIAGLYNLMLAE